MAELITTELLLNAAAATVLCLTKTDEDFNTLFKDWHSAVETEIPLTLLNRNANASILKAIGLDITQKIIRKNGITLRKVNGILEPISKLYHKDIAFDSTEGQFYIHGKVLYRFGIDLQAVLLVKSQNAIEGKDLIIGCFLDMLGVARIIPDLEFLKFTSPILSNLQINVRHPRYSEAAIMNGKLRNSVKEAITIYERVSSTSSNTPPKKEGTPGIPTPKKEDTTSDEDFDPSMEDWENVDALGLGIQRLGPYDATIVKKLLWGRISTADRFRIFNHNQKKQIMKTIAIKTAIHGTRIKSDSTFILPDDTIITQEEIGSILGYKQQGIGTTQDQLTPTRVARAFADTARTYLIDHENVIPPLFIQPTVAVAGLERELHFLNATTCTGLTDIQKNNLLLLTFRWDVTLWKQDVLTDARAGWFIRTVALFRGVPEANALRDLYATYMIKYIQEELAGLTKITEMLNLLGLSATDAQGLKEDTVDMKKKFAKVKRQKSRSKKRQARGGGAGNDDTDEDDD